MFASSSLTILLSAVTVMASTHQARNHHAVAKRIVANNTFTGSIDKRAAFNNKEFTWYPTDTGPDACTGKNHQDSDFFVAMGFNQFGDGSACCGKQLSITVNGKTATASCVDECASCPDVGQLDFTKGLFEYFTGGDLGVGVIYGSWSYTDGSGGGNDDPTTTTTTTHHTTTSTPHPTTTSTHHTTTSTYVEEVVPTTTHHSSSSSVKASSSSKKASSSAKPSSSSVKPSSSASASAKASSSIIVKSSPSSSALPIPVPTPTEGVANAGSAAGSSAGSGDPDQISGALTGSDDSSDAASLSFNKLFATVAVVALVAAQAL